MEQSGLLVSENLFESILALVEAAYRRLKLSTPKKGTLSQPSQVGSLGLQIQGLSLPLTKNGKTEAQMDHCSQCTVV